MTIRTAKPLLGLVVAAAAALAVAPSAFTREAKPTAVKPIKALLVTGGGYHDYEHQKMILPEGVSKRANVEWTVVHDNSKDDGHKMDIFNDPNWADGYDIVVHNECFANVTDKDYIAKIVDAHKKGTPAIVMHCAMHTFRALKTDEWREFLGVSSFNHGRQHPLDVKVVAPDHPIMKGFPDGWVTANEELYRIEKVWPGTTVLAKAKAEDDPNKKEHGVVWVHTFGKGKVFGTTMAHNNKTMSDPVYLDLFTRGLLWACDKLGEDGKPLEGYGK